MRYLNALESMSKDDISSDLDFIKKCVVILFSEDNYNARFEELINLKSIELLK
jgi:hypothetical protein